MGSCSAAIGNNEFINVYTKGHTLGDAELGRYNNIFRYLTNSEGRTGETAAKIEARQRSIFSEDMKRPEQSLLMRLKSILNQVGKDSQPDLSPQTIAKLDELLTIFGDDPDLTRKLVQEKIHPEALNALAEFRAAPPNTGNTDHVTLDNVVHIRSATDSLPAPHAVELEKPVQESALATEKANATEARTSGLLRGLSEVFEFMGRWMSPFMNLLSAATRLGNLAMSLVRGEEVDWSKEGLRLAGDLTGTLFPPMGAMANSALNLYYNESEILGGANRYVDEGRKDNYFRRQWDGIVDSVKSVPTTGGHHADSLTAAAISV